ncbi:MAG: hypothetical protein CVT98_05515 [Bacteroidetes bacterium HGW-Bacteroidetes-15]|nr:MAG: hypothetical protein CVT98_05515 [Bacteroidetes bacterium HGW-Bacteroidetes-15]
MNAVINENSNYISESVVEVLNSYPFLQFGTFLTNHDMNRVMSVLNEDEAKAKLAASLLLTLPGIPYIYYGEEIGMTGVKPDEYIRTPMQWTANSNAGFTQGTPWIAVNSDYTLKNVEDQQSNPNSLWSLYRDLIEIRNNEASLRRGNYKPVHTSNTSIFAFVRHYESDNVFVISNLSDNQVSDISLQLPFSGVTSGEYSLYDLLGGGAQSITISGDGYTAVTINDLPAQSTRIYTLKSPGTGVFNYSIPEIEVNLFPVPANDIVFAKISSNRSGKVDYTIMDMTGRRIITSSFWHTESDQNHGIAIGDLTRGFYIINFKFNGSIKSKRFIVQ